MLHTHVARASSSQLLMFCPSALRHRRRRAASSADPPSRFASGYRQAHDLNRGGRASRRDVRANQPFTSGVTQSNELRFSVSGAKEEIRDALHTCICV